MSSCLYVCMFVYIQYICMYMYVCIRMYLCVYIYICVMHEGQEHVAPVSGFVGSWQDLRSSILIRWRRKLCRWKQRPGSS